MAANPKDRWGNWILDALPESEYSEFLDQLECIELGIRHVVHEPGKAFRSIHFPVTSVFSTTASTDDGGIVEVATLGREGVVGLNVFLGHPESALTVFSQVPGSSWRSPVKAFQTALQNGSWLRDALHRYTQCLMVQMSQGLVCNVRHNVTQRCARWLLMTLDRVGKPEFVLTQEFLSQMLGVRRGSVNEAATTLQNDGLIDYTRGKIRVLNRSGLEAVSCECYQKIHTEYQRFRKEIRVR